MESVPLTEVRRLFETNFFGAARMIQAFVPAMRASAGSGRGGERHVGQRRGRRPHLPAYYSASKFALEGLSESLHLEVGHFGVRVVVIEPGVHRDEVQRQRHRPPARARPLRGAGHPVGGGIGHARRRRRPSGPRAGRRHHRRSARGRPLPPPLAGRRRRRPRHRRARGDRATTTSRPACREVLHRERQALTDVRRGCRAKRRRDPPGSNPEQRVEADGEARAVGDLLAPRAARRA